MAAAEKEDEKSVEERERSAKRVDGEVAERLGRLTDEQVEEFADDVIAAKSRIGWSPTQG